jgi:hypothetical protein
VSQKISKRGKKRRNEEGRREEVGSEGRKGRRKSVEGRDQRRGEKEYLRQSKHNCEVLDQGDRANSRFCCGQCLV